MFREIPVSLIDEWEARNESDSEDLASSFALVGQLSPILVRRHPSESGRFQIIFGNRRLNAARKLGWKRITARILNVAEADSLVLALCENLDRQDLPDFDKALMLERLHRVTNKSYGDIAKMIGKSNSFVSQHVAMIRLFADEYGTPSERRKILLALTEKHARALSRIEDSMDRWNTAKLVVNGKLASREAERFCKNFSRKKVNYRLDNEQNKVREVIVSFVSGFCSKDITPFFEAVSARHFTMFPRFTPLTKLEFDSAKDYFCKILSKMDSFKENIEDMEIRVCGSFAYATMFIGYEMAITGKFILSKGRATIILAKEKQSWKILHAHWSTAEPNSLDVLTLIASLKTNNGFSTGYSENPSLLNH